MPASTHCLGPHRNERVSRFLAMLALLSTVITLTVDAQEEPNARHGFLYSEGTLFDSLTTMELTRYPTRDIVEAAGYQFAVDKLDAINEFRIRADKPNTAAFFVDGIPVRSSQLPASSGVQSLHVRTGYLPPSFGENVGSIVEMETKKRSDTGGRFFLEHYRETTGWPDGQFVTGQFGTYQRPFNSDFAIDLSVNFELQRDTPAGYAAAPYPSLTADARTRLQTSPQSIHARNMETRAIEVIPLPSNLLDGIREDELLEALGLDQTHEIYSDNLQPTAYGLRPEDFTTGAFSDIFNQRSDVAGGRLSLAFRDLISVDIARDLRRLQRDIYDSYYSITNFERSPVSEQSYNGNHYTIRLSPFDGVRINGSQSSRQTDNVLKDPLFTGRVEDLAMLSDIHHPANQSVASLYHWERNYGVVDSLISGNIFDARGHLLWHYAPVTGTPFAALERRSEEDFYRSVSGSVEIGSTRLEMGWSHTRKLDRLWNADPDDVLLISKMFAERSDNLNTWTDINRNGRIEYYEFDSIDVREGSFYGFSFNGISEAAETVFDESLVGDHRSVQPFSGHENAYYGNLSVDASDIRLDVGVRIQRNWNNGLSLRDPWVDYPVLRLQDIDSLSASGNIGPELVVYFSGRTIMVDGEREYVQFVSGYRDSNGTAFDADGNPIRLEDLVGFPERKFLGNDATIEDFFSEILQPSREDASVLPRFRLTLIPANGIELLFYFGQYARAPLEYQRSTTVDYSYYRNYYDYIPNAGLTTEKTRQYGIALTRQFGDHWISTELYRRELSDLVVRDWAPSSRRTNPGLFMNNGSGRVSAALVQAGVKLGEKASYRLFYNLENTRGERSVSWPDWYSRRNYETATGSMETERLHKAGIDFTVSNTGPNRTKGVLGNTTLSLFFRAGSGIRYEPRRWARSELDPRSLDRPSLFRRTAEPYYRLDLAAEKSLALPRVTLTAFVWVQNLLNRTNVNRVYPFSGEPDTDGFYDFHESRGYGVSSLRTLHDMRLFNPDHTGMPRVIRIGFRLDV